MEKNSVRIYLLNVSAILATIVGMLLASFVIGHRQGRRVDQRGYTSL